MPLHRGVNFSSSFESTGYRIALHWRQFLNVQARRNQWKLVFRKILKEYIPVGKKAAVEQSEFFAHLISWNRTKGQVRDSKIALPLVSLMAPTLHPEFVENALAHLTQLGPREQLRGLRFVLENRIPGHMTSIMHVLGVSLLEREKNWPKWERVMLQHRSVLKELFALLHVKPQDDRTKACLWRSDKVNGKRVKLDYPAGGLFETVSRLKDMSPQEAAGTILQKKLPFLIVAGALGKNANEPDLVLALIKAMTPTELTTNTAMLQKMGVKSNPALRGAFQEALEKAAQSTTTMFKTGTAVEALDDEELKDNLRGLQEKQLQKHSGIEGNWAVFGDKSGSMSRAIEVSREVAGVLAKMVKGNVTLIFFDVTPMTIDVTGASLDIIKKGTRHIQAGGGTSIGCALLALLEAKKEIDGVAVVSDGGENTVPYFADVYKRYSTQFGKEIPVYLYLTEGEPNVFVHNLSKAGIDLQSFDLRGQKPDQYSLANLVSTMRTNRYSLGDEIMQVRLLQLSDVYKTTAKKAARA